MAAGALKKTASGKVSGFLGGGIGKSTLFGSRAFGSAGTGGPGGSGSVGGGSVGLGRLAGVRGMLGIGDRRQREQQRRAASQGSEALGALVGQYNRAYGSAKQANEARYQQLLKLSGEDYQRTKGIQEQMLGVAEQTTGQRAADIRSGGAEEESNVLQRLRSLGMSGTTIAPTLRAGVRRETESSLNRLADTMQGTKLGIMGQQAAHTRQAGLGIMERRTDAYPEMGAITSLTEQLGRVPGASFSGLGKMRLG